MSVDDIANGIQGIVKALAKLHCELCTWSSECDGLANFVKLGQCEIYVPVGRLFSRSLLHCQKGVRTMEMHTH